MAITMASLAHGKDGNSVAGATTASFTPTANALVFLFTVSENNGGGPNISPGNANGLTWVNIFDANVYGLTGTSSLGCWRAMATSPSTGTMFISYNSGTNLFWNIVEFRGVDTSGTSGSGALVQVAQAFAASSPCNVPMTTTVPTNAIVGFIGGHDSGAGLGVGSGFTLINSDSDAGVGDCYLSQWKTGVAQAVCDFTFGSASGTRGIAFEILAGGGTVPTTGAPSGLVVGAGF